MLIPHLSPGKKFPGTNHSANNACPHASPQFSWQEQNLRPLLISHETPCSFNASDQVLVCMHQSSDHLAGRKTVEPGGGNSFLRPSGRDTYQKENWFLSKRHWFAKKIAPTPLVLVCWFPGRLALWSLCPDPLVPWSLGPLVCWSVWSLGPLVPCSFFLGPLVLWSSGPLVLRPGLQVLESVLSRQDAFKVIWKSGHTSCDAP